MKSSLKYLAAVAAVLSGTAAVAAEVPGEQSRHCDLDANPVVDDDELSADLRQFLGIFDGKWQKELPHTLIVYQVSPTGDAKGYYAYAKYPKWRIRAPACVFFLGEIKGGVLRLTLDNGAAVTYTFDPKGRLQGTYVLNGRPTKGTFTATYQVIPAGAPAKKQ